MYGCVFFLWLAGLAISSGEASSISLKSLYASQVPRSKRVLAFGIRERERVTVRHGKKLQTRIRSYNELPWISELVEPKNEQSQISASSGPIDSDSWWLQQPNHSRLRIAPYQLEDLNRMFFAFYAEQRALVCEAASGDVDTKNYEKLMFAFTSHAVRTLDHANMQWIVTELQNCKHVGVFQAVVRALFLTDVGDKPRGFQQFWHEYRSAQFRENYWKELIQKVLDHGLNTMEIIRVTHCISDEHQRDRFLDKVFEVSRTRNVLDAINQIREEYFKDNSNLTQFCAESASINLVESDKLWDDMHDQYVAMLRKGYSRDTFIAWISEAEQHLCKKYSISQELLHFGRDLVIQNVEMNHPVYSVQSNRSFRRLVGQYKAWLGLFKYVFELPRDEDEASRRLSILIRLLAYTEWRLNDYVTMFTILASQGVLSSCIQSDAKKEEVDIVLTRSGVKNDLSHLESIYTKSSLWMIAHAVVYGLGYCRDQNTRTKTKWNESLSLRVRLVLYGLACNPDINRSRKGAYRSALLHLTRSLNDDEKIILSEILFEHTDLAQTAARELLHVNFIGLSQSLDCHDSFASFFDAFLSRDALCIPEYRWNDVAQVATDDFNHPEDLDLELFEGGVSHGRSLYVPSEKLALKLRKSTETLEDLKHEFKMIKTLQKWKNELGLKSQVPTDPKLVKCTITAEVFDLLAEQAATGDFSLGFSPTEHLLCLTFNPPPGYRLHLHQLETKELLINSSLVVLHDMALLARNGIVSNAPSDLFHNEYEERRFVSLKDLCSRKTRYGTGRCTKWQHGIRHCNFGLNIRDPKTWTQWPKEDPGLALTDYLFAWTLAVGYWYISHGDLQMDGLETILLDGFTEFMSTFTKRPRILVRGFLENSLDYKMLAGQLQYFLSGDYRHDIQKGFVRKNIFRPITRVFVSSIQGDYWHPELGWSTDGIHADLGPLNGPFPVQSLIQHLYFVLVMSLNLKKND